MKEKILAAIDEIRPALQNDGGDISVEKIEGKIVHVKLHGHCAGCPMSQMTLSNGVERYLKETVDKDIVVVNDEMFWDNSKARKGSGKKTGTFLLVSSIVIEMFHEEHLLF